MSIEQVIPYFKGRLEGLGFREWPDNFTHDRIPETIMDRSFHVQMNEVTFGPVNQTVQDVESQVLVSVIFKGHRNESQAKEEAILALKKIILDICKAINRTSLLKNVIAESSTIAALSEENERSVIIEITFSAFTLLGLEESP